MSGATQVDAAQVLDGLARMVAERVVAMLPAQAPVAAVGGAAERLEVLKRRELLTEGEVEELYGIPRASLNSMRSRGQGPAYITRGEGGRRIGYRHRDVQAYLDAGRVKTRDQD
jgi:hypothetical protein